MKDTEIIRKKAQNLRKNATKEETKLWYGFLKTYPVQFRRQVPFGPYFVDFFCHKANLVIELDGSQHCEPCDIEYDCKRTAYLEGMGLRVIRISNLDVMWQFRAVCEMIDDTVRRRLSPP